jgi:hypothetical protein
MLSAYLWSTLWWEEYNLEDYESELELEENLPEEPSESIVENTEISEAQ